MQQINNFAQANEYLARFYDNARTEYTLDSLLKLMEFLGNPQDKFKTIHVAGTSGKTSTAYYVSALLTAAGNKTALTVSPHVDGFNERVQINGQPVSETEFCEALSIFSNLVDQSRAKPSWFELMVAFAYWYFAEQQVDYVVVEVGLGGLKDGTNVITRSDKVCIITDIGLDHTHILGNSLTEIATQKAGIIHEGNVVFTYDQGNEITAAIKRAAEQKQAELHVVESVEESELPDFQKRNWSLAYAAYKYLANRDNLRHLTSQVLAETQGVYIPGRMDIREIEGKILVMDGAHNFQKMTAFIDSFQELYPGVKPAVMLGVKDDKQYQEIVPIITRMASRIITTTFDANQDFLIKSTSAEALAQAFENNAVPVISISDQHKAYQALINGSEKVCVITGSFYLISQIRAKEHLV